MKTAVVIPTIGRPEHLVQTVRDLADQDHENFEVLIVDQSEQANQTLIDEFRSQSLKIHYFHVSFNGLPVARNFAWQQTDADFLIFIDDDVRIPKNFVSRHLEAIKNQEIGVVAGGITELFRKEHDAKHIGKFIPWTATPYRGYNRKEDQEVDHAPGGNFSTFRSVLEAVGGFDEAFALGAALYEETDFCLRVKEITGKKVFFSSGAHLDHIAAPAGGCRVLESDEYMWSLSRNRAILFRRHLKWYHLPTAYLRWMALVASYLKSTKNWKIPLAATKGWFNGTFRVKETAELTDRSHQVIKEIRLPESE